MLEQVSYYPLLGKPLIMYLGLLTLGAFLLTAAVAVLNRKGIRTLPFAWHPRCAMIAIGLALLHGILGVLVYW